ncbi:MAG: right-handed parallel beta-helix repeat-containing protein [Pseudomonadota bacterium]
MTTISVDSSAGLLAALKSAQGGETILLAPGVYTDLKWKISPKFDVAVTITSADPSNMAVINDFRISGGGGLHFSQLEFSTLDNSALVANDGSYWAYKFYNSNDISFDRVKVHGSLDGNAGNDVSGISLAGTSNISITNSEFQQLERAIAFGGGSSNIKIVGNSFHDLRSDGMNFVEVRNVEIRNNILRDFVPKEGDHPDAIQFWTTHAKTPSTDILIASNVILKGAGDHVQGIFLRDQQGTLPYERVTITDNLLVGTGYNGIRITGVKDLTVTNNDLVTFDGGLKTFMLVRSADGAVATGNSAAYVAFEQSANVENRGNKSASPVKDEGEASIRKWLIAHPAEAAGLKGIFPIEFFPAEAPTSPLVPVNWSADPFAPTDFDVNAPRLDFGSYGGASGYLFA